MFPELLVHFFQDFRFKVLLVIHRPDIDMFLHVLTCGEDGPRVRGEVILIDLDFISAVDFHNFSLCYLTAHLNFTFVTLVDETLCFVRLNFNYIIRKT